MGGLQKLLYLLRCFGCHEQPGHGWQGGDTAENQGCSLKAGMGRAGMCRGSSPAARSSDLRVLGGKPAGESRAACRPPCRSPLAKNNPSSHLSALICEVSRRSHLGTKRNGLRPELRAHGTLVPLGLGSLGAAAAAGGGAGSAGGPCPPSWQERALSPSAKMMKPGMPSVCIRSRASLITRGYL